MRTKLGHVQALYDFLQGRGSVDGNHIKTAPKLSAEEAWTAVWFVQESQQRYSDEIEKCGVCGELFDSASQGICLDYGDPPYQFCDDCTVSDAYETKLSADPEKVVDE